MLILQHISFYLLEQVGTCKIDIPFTQNVCLYKSITRTAFLLKGEEKKNVVNSEKLNCSSSIQKECFHNEIKEKAITPVFTIEILRTN